MSDPIKLPTFENIEFKVEDKIAYVIINRPSKFNSFTLKLLAEVEAAIEFINDNYDLDVRALILYGNGKHFSAGLDLGDLKRLLFFDKTQ